MFRSESHQAGTHGACDREIEMRATLYRPTVTRYKDANGKFLRRKEPGATPVKQKSKTWRGRYKDANGKICTVALFDDRELSEARLAQIVQEQRDIKAGVQKRDPFAGFRELPLVCPKCSGAGCKGSRGRSVRCDANHADAFHSYLLSKDNTESHANQTVGRVRRTLIGCRFVELDDLDGGRVAGWLADRRKAKTDALSAATSNAYVAAIKAFGNWLVKDRRVAESPFSHLSRINGRVDMRVVRRALMDEELARLVAAAEVGEPFQGLSGPDRAMLYLFAAFTGLRANELHSLTERSLEFGTDPPTVTVDAGYSKHRREDVLPLHNELAGRLQVWLDQRRRSQAGEPIIPLNGRPPAAKLFSGTWHKKAAKMIRRDLQAARDAWKGESVSAVDHEQRSQSEFLEFETEHGRADFHALRHTFITNLAGSGVHPKLAKELARHSTITLTMDRYAHVSVLDMHAALESLPGIPETPDRDRSQATGTDQALPCVVPDVATNGGNPASPHVFSPVLDSTTAEPAADRIVRPVQHLRQEPRTPDKKKRVRAQGLEPWTYGLKVRCSTN